MSGRIVVGVDGSDTSNRALIWAARHAMRRESQLDIVFTWQSPAGATTPMGMAYIPPPSEALEQQAEESLARIVAECALVFDLDAIRWESTAAEGEASHVLCNAARGADMLVVGSRGLGGFKGLVLGSVSSRCANASPCPVAIIPAEWEPAAPSHGTVVVGVDGSSNSEAATQWADAWAPADSTLRLVCAWSYPTGNPMADRGLDEATLEAACSEVIATAANLVSEHTAEARAVHKDARLALAAEARDADALVIGARGHSGFSRLMVGSVASSLVHHLTVPTILVRTEDDNSDND